MSKKLLIKTPTTHINAKLGDIAPIVLMPGDPVRAQWIAKNFLKKVKRFSMVRNITCFTGIAPNGKLVSVMASGMGQPSLSIYVTELIVAFGVKVIIRVGSAGSLQEDINKNAIVIATGASTDSGMNNSRFPFAHFAPIADPSLVSKAQKIAKKLNIKVNVGGILASDKFYPDMDSKTLEFNWDAWKIFAEYGVLAVEMESAELYTLAALHGVQALSILTISDTLAKKSKPLSSKKRESSFSKMIEIALSL